MSSLLLIVIVMFNKLSPESKLLLKIEAPYPQERAISPKSPASRVPRS
jgi:hypothetical protein